MSERTTPAVRGNAVIAAKDQGRECCFQIRWTLPSDIPQEPLALLVGLLNESPKAYLDTRDFALHMALLGGAELGFGLDRRSGHYRITLAASVTSNRFMRSVIPVEKKLVSAAKRLVRYGPRLDPVSLSLARGKLIRLNADYEGNPSGVAASHLASLFPESSLMAAPGGSTSLLKEITAEQVGNAYKALLKAPCVIAAKNLPAGALNSLLKAFGSDKVEVIEERPTECHTNTSMPLIYLTQTSSSDVIRRCYRFSGPLGYDLDSWMLRSVLNQTLMGSDSILFKEIREKRGLTYSVTSSFGVNSDVLTVSLKTNLRRGAEAVDALDLVMGSARELATDEMIESAKLDCIRTFQESLSSSSSLCSTQLSALERGVDPDITKWIETIEKIDPERVREALGELAPLTGVIVTQPQEA